MVQKIKAKKTSKASKKPSLRKAVFEKGDKINQWQIIEVQIVNGNKQYILENRKLKKQKAIFHGNMDEFIKAEVRAFLRHVSKNWVGFIEYVNEYLKLPVYGKNSEHWLKPYKTGDRTKLLTPFISTWFFEYFDTKDNPVIRREINGKDFIWNGIDFELKLSLCDNIGWTGNGTRKVNYHFLMKMRLDENYLIAESFAAIVPLKTTLSSWSEPSSDMTEGKRSNFSGLRLLNKDKSRVYLIHGDVRPGTDYLQMELK